MIHFFNNSLINKKYTITCEKVSLQQAIRHYPGGAGPMIPYKGPGGSSRSGKWGKPYGTFENMNPGFNKLPNITPSQVWIPETIEELLKVRDNLILENIEVKQQEWTFTYNKLIHDDGFNKKSISEKYKYMINYITEERKISPPNIVSDVVTEKKKDTESTITEITKPKILTVINNIYHYRENFVNKGRNFLTNLLNKLSPISDLVNADLKITTDEDQAIPKKTQKVDSNNNNNPNPNTSFQQEVFQSSSNRSALVHYDALSCNNIGVYAYIALFKQHTNGFVDMNFANFLVKKIENKEIKNTGISQEYKKNLFIRNCFLKQSPDEYSTMIQELITHNYNIPEECLKKYLLYLQKDVELSPKDLSLFTILEDYFNNKFNKNVEIHLNDNDVLRLFTKDDHLNEIEKLSKLRTQFVNKQITNKDMFDCLHRAGIIKYPDIYYKGAYLMHDPQTKQLLLHEEKMIFKDGEGAKIPHKIYESLLQKAQKKSCNLKPTTKQVEIIKASIQKQQFFAGIVVTKKNETLVLTGLDNHISLFVADPDNPDYMYSIGFFTSSKDEGTVQLSPQQEFNFDTQETNKAQSFRPAKMLIRVKKTDIMKHEDANKFAHGYNINDEYIPEKIISLSQKAQNSWSTFKILDNLTLDKELLIELAVENLNNLIMKYSDVIKNIENNNDEKKNRLTEQQKANYIKDLKQQKKKNILTSQENLYYQIKQILAVKIKKTFPKTENQNIIYNPFIND